MRPVSFRSGSVLRAPAMPPHRREPAIKAARYAAVVTVIAAATTAMHFFEQTQQRIRQHDSVLTGYMWLQELLDSPNPARLRNQLGMYKSTFLKLVSELQRNCGLGPTRHMTVVEQVGIFLYAAVTNLPNRKLAERFQRSGDTISKCVHCSYHFECIDLLRRCLHRVLAAILSQDFYGHYVRLPGPNSDVPREIRSNKAFFPFFKDALGATDGTHIMVVPPTEDAARFRNRKGYLSINALITCLFDMRICYVLSGWEGSAADSHIFEQARCTDYVIPPGKYYLADAGFPICDSALVPYRGVRYHLREWSIVGNRCVHCILIRHH